MTRMNRNIRVEERAGPRGVVTLSEAIYVPKTLPPVLIQRMVGGQLKTFHPDGTELTRGGRIRRGRLLYTNGNLVTQRGRTRCAALWGGVSGDFPMNVAAGDGGLATGTDVPIPPVDGATELEHEVARVEIQQRLLNEVVPTMTFVALFQSAGSYQFAQPGNSRISEIGLFTQDDTLVAVHNFAPIPVDVHRIGILVEWEFAII